MSNGDTQLKEKREIIKSKYKSKDASTKYDNKNISISNLGDEYTGKSNGESSTNLHKDFD